MLMEASVADRGTGGSSLPEASMVDSGAGGTEGDVSVGPCPVLTGNDACAKVPHFTARTQVVDGIGDEFCDVPAMEFDVATCPKVLTFGSEPGALPEKVFLRIAWSPDAFHLHIRVIDPSVSTSSFIAARSFWWVSSVRYSLPGLGLVTSPQRQSVTREALRISAGSSSGKLA
jgi:hypothetical protein